MKAKASLQARDVVGLCKLAELAGHQFISGFVLSDGKETLPMEPRLWVVPLPTLWRQVSATPSP